MVAIKFGLYSIAVSLCENYSKMCEIEPFIKLATENSSKKKLFYSPFSRAPTLSIVLWLQKNECSLQYVVVIVLTAITADEILEENDLHFSAIAAH